MRSNTSRGGWLASWALALAVVMTPALSRAYNPCTDQAVPIPDCLLQVQAPVSYTGWQTQGWAYYCTGDHPYFWGLRQSGACGSVSFDNSCFSVTENAFAETTPSKFDATITNWCLNTQSITVTLACSAQAPPPGPQPC
jgi:hypothetical protein